MQIEHEKARQWRERHRLSREALARLSGYSVLAIYWMERGQSARGQPVWPNIWRRYKLVCAGIDHQLKSEEFNW
jgi:hypothetical protein